jgi:Xaa-Pro aminopeptidase
MTEKQVATELLKFMINHGASSLSFPTIVSFGANAANPHSTPTNRKLKKHEFILVDAGCVYNGYCSDITRV